ncbi:MAG: hypothetical protein GXP49_05185, partial [Deltaproteobacteria bacterium]|nr:hypothetical protein [Deltaproteobacteria bacterium]
TEDGEIPAGEEPNWLTYNSFRQNEQGEGVFDAPDLTIKLWLDTKHCPGEIDFICKVMNIGALGVAPGLPVSFYYGTDASPGDYLGTAKTTEAILPGGASLLRWTWKVPAGGVKDSKFFARADDKGDGTGTQNECNEDNNTDGTDIATAEKCNGEDDNCNGVIDEGCDCITGATEPCGTDVGLCEFGTSTCDEKGKWGPCQGGVGPVEEKCNGEDDNCNGVTDEGCNCIDGATKPCGTDVGLCEFGTTTCDENGKWGPCEGGIGPVDEICNCKDDDCNGKDDDADNLCEPPTSCVECACREPCVFGECPSGFVCKDNYCVPK